MEKVGSREFKNRMGRYIRAVRNGNALVLTNRGNPLVKIVPLDDTAAEPSVMEKLKQLEAAGKIRLGSGRFKKCRPVKIKGKPISQTIIEDRR